ncbi:alpha/beta-hydrolase, partial [Neoconidiobolus thromboides FSU 785]
KRYLRLAGTSYCPTETLKTWKCGHCQKLSTVEYQETIEDPNTQTRAIIAVDKTKKEIIISFRGSSNLRNWFQNVQTLPFNSEQAIIDATVHSGFKTCNDNLKKLYIPVIKKLVKKYPKFTVVVTGHSLGGAVATLATLSINFEVRIKFSKMRLVTFCQPRVGNDKFAAWMNKNVLDSTRFTNNNDPVPRLPISSFGFVHQHTEVYIKGNTAKVCSNKMMEDNTC